MSRIESLVGMPSTMLPGKSAAAVAARGVTVTAVEALPEPTRLVATTEQDQAVPLVRPLILSGLVLPVALRFVVPAVQVAVYPVIVAPPSLDGAAKTMLALPSPAVALTPVGVPGTVAELPVAGALVAAPAPLLLPPPPQAVSRQAVSSIVWISSESLFIDSQGSW